MFVSRYNTYLAVIDREIVQKFLCTYYEDDAPPAATEDDIETAGFEVHRQVVTRVGFYRKGQGYLSARPDLSNGYSNVMQDRETFRLIDPSILPPPVPEMPEEAHIAHKIHQIGIFPKEPGVYPEAFIENRNNIVALNQNYTFYFWSEGGYYDIEEFIQKHYGEEILKYYRAISPDYLAARADFFRYLCLYAIGGVYLDLKTAMSYPLDLVVRPEDRFLLSFWCHGARPHTEIEHIPYGEYEQYYIICAAGHPLMRRIIQQVLCSIALYKRPIHGTGAYGILRVTGPLLYSMIVHEYRDRYEDIVRQIHSFSNGIEYTIFDDNMAHHEHVGKDTHYSRRESNIINSEMLI
ncbi:hypothetical protein DTJ15_05240 [Parasaccharibacter sp. TMW 2.1891]|uniref:glycosyltransferase family 32 protein n=1 Tax=Parasaccharibacter sp. TMW 2.1891 TaxID=2267836 RepID=UPI0020110745|nr:glycosyltransferase [Parasaccharibacter sp. TMW 2.1891]MCL1513609.1 hypothetical protein [Parasaccharibacter sp. TMW 2.1891]